MRRIVGILLVAGFVVAVATSLPARAGEIDRVDSAFLKWVPVLMADQQKLFSMTRTYLKNPDDVSNVLLQSGRLRTHVEQAYPTFRYIRSDNARLIQIRDRMSVAVANFRQGVTYWNDFLRRHFAYVHAGVADPAAKTIMLKQHDTAERWFNHAWGQISMVNHLLGNPIGNQRTKPPPTPNATVPAGADPIVGDWEAGGGVMRVTKSGTTTFEGKLVKTYTFCSSGSVPLGQVEWAITRTAAFNYKGTVRFYRVSNCTYIGDAKGATWKYQPADDTLYGCSYSPDPSLPGGGCATMKRVKGA